MGKKVDAYGALCGPAKSASVNVSVRPLDNGGFVKRVEHYGDGDFKSTETYHADQPSLDAEEAKESSQKGSSLRDAFKSLR